MSKKIYCDVCENEIKPGQRLAKLLTMNLMAVQGKLMEAPKEEDLCESCKNAVQCEMEKLRKQNETKT